MVNHISALIICNPINRSIPAVEDGKYAFKGAPEKAENGNALVKLELPSSLTEDTDKFIQLLVTSVNDEDDLYASWPAEDGNLYIVVPAGDYYFQISSSSITDETLYYGMSLSEEGWVAEETALDNILDLFASGNSDYTPVHLDEGSVTDLPADGLEQGLAGK